MIHRVKQTDDGDDGGGVGQHDAQEKADVVAAVDVSRFLQFVGDAGGEKRAGDDQIPGGNGARKHQRPHGVEQFQVFHQQIGGDHAAAKEHGEEHHPVERRAQGEGAAREHERARHRQSQVDAGAQHGIKNGVEVAAPQRVVFYHALKPLGVEALGQEQHAARVDLFGRGNRRNQAQVHRVEK